MLTQQSMVENEYGIAASHLSLFTLLEHLMIMLLKYRASLNFVHLIKDTDSM